MTAIQRHAPTVFRASLTRLSEPQIIFPALTLLVLGVIWSATLNLIKVERANAEKAATTASRELVNTYQAQVVRAIREIDQTLKLVKYVYETKGSDAALEDLKARTLLPPELLFTIRIVNRQGLMDASTRPAEAPPAGAVGVLSALRASDTLWIDTPKKNLASQDWTLQFARRLNAADGSFAGAVLLGVDASYFVSGYDAAQLGKQGTLGLLGTDGVFLARRTGERLTAGDVVDYATVVPATGPGEATVALERNNWDGIWRYAATQQLFDFPLAVIVGLSEQEQSAAAHRNAEMYRWRAAVGSGLLIVLTTLLGRMSWQLARGREMFRRMVESTKAIPFTLDITHGCFTYLGTQGIVDSAIPDSQSKAHGALDSVIPRDVNPEIRQRLDECAVGPFEFVAPLAPRNGQRTEVRWTGTCEMVKGAKYLRGLMLDVTELHRLERELAAAQKLESVGRLAAGVAHEINTPVQFVSDNVQFVRTSMTDVAAVVQAYRSLQHAVVSAGDVAAAARLASDAENSADFDFILENVPPALDSSLEGLGRIATIVRSMKEFAHPDQTEKTLANLNQAIKNTLVIAHNEYKYVAEVDTDFGDLPLVPCYLGEINQVVLNLLVNAAHAISDVVKDSGAMGKLTVRTRLDANEVEIAIGDTGTGIPEAAREKVFDPFFTTKEVGRGTGQGLAIAHSVIVNKHGGTLRFETERGKGTTFFIRLPVGGPAAERSVE